MKKSCGRPFQQGAIVRGKVHERPRPQNFEDKKQKEGSPDDHYGGALLDARVALACRLAASLSAASAFFLLFRKFFFPADDRIASLQVHDFLRKKTRRERHDAVGDLFTNHHHAGDPPIDKRYDQSVAKFYGVLGQLVRPIGIELEVAADRSIRRRERVKSDNVPFRDDRAPFE